jgi:hypothetical protein
MLKLRKAQRQQGKIKLALQGPSGAGKTYSALLLAKGLVGGLDKVAVIDTDSNSADLYDYLGNFSVLSLGPPFTPEKYIEAIRICENAGMEAIILDSISHEWYGSGGILDVHSGMQGNSFTNWSKLTPRHNQFVHSILQASCHVIATMRTKQAYVLNERNGKMVPEKVGLKAIAREDTEYEFTVVLEINQKHFARASKDRTGLFTDMPDFVITEDTGHQIRNWCTKPVSSNPTAIGTVIQQLKFTQNGVKNAE